MGTHIAVLEDILVYGGYSPTGGDTAAARSDSIIKSYTKLKCDPKPSHATGMLALISKSRLSSYCNHGSCMCVD